MIINPKKIFERYTFQKQRPKTVHYMFPLVALALGLLGAALSGEPGSYLTLTASPQKVSAGGNVSISIDAVAQKPVNAIDIQIAFPTDKLQITDVSTGESVITLWTDQPKIDNGKVLLRGGVYRKGFLGRHHIATLQGKALQNGTAEVMVRNMTFLAGDGSGAPVKLDTTNEAEKVLVTVGDTVDSAGTSVGGNTLSGNIKVEVVTDIDGNGKVDFLDIERFMKAWHSQESVFDFDGDGRMTFKDFAILLSDSFWK